MQIVIDIPEETYKKICGYSLHHIDFCYSDDVAILAIKNGIPLPKGHGDLKDIGNIRLDKFIRIENFSLTPRFSEDFKKGYNAAVDNVSYVLMSAPVLIEADKEVDE